MVEVVLGREPVESGLLNTEARNALAEATVQPLLYFAAAKGDLQAVHLLVAIGRASSSAIQQHGGDSSLEVVLGRPLARLMSKPTIRQQLQFLRMVYPALFNAGTPDIEVFLSVAKSRFAVRIDGSVNDTALHVAA
jgi:hypothetical protein